MPRLIWVFAGRTVTLWVLSCRGSILVMYIIVVSHLLHCPVYLFSKRQSEATSVFGEAILMSSRNLGQLGPSRNVCLYGELLKLIRLLSPNTRLICFTVSLHDNSWHRRRRKKNATNLQQRAQWEPESSSLTWISGWHELWWRTGWWYRWLTSWE